MGSADFSSVDLLTFAFESAPSGDDTTPVYIDAEAPDRFLSKAQARSLVRKLVGGWQAAGLSQGDPVLVVLANNVLYSVLYYSIIGAGGVFFGVNPASQVFELNHILQSSTPRFIITSGDILPNVMEALQSTSLSSESVFVLDEKGFPLPIDVSSSNVGIAEVNHFAAIRRPRQNVDLMWLASHAETDWNRIYDEETARSRPAAMFITSETSGLPKITVSSHFALITQHMSMESLPSYAVSRLISLPLFHGFTMLFAHVSPVRLGQPLYILPRFHPEQYVNTIKRFSITDSIMIPPMMHVLSRSRLPLLNLRESIRWIRVEGAPIADDEMRKFRTLLHASATLSQVCGMMESDEAMVVHYAEQDCDGGINRPVPGSEVRLADSFGGKVSLDYGPGELYVRHGGMMTGHRHQSPHDRGDWIAISNIMVRVDENSHVIGRSEELIKVNGWPVATAEIESVLLSHPCINDVGVIGVLREDGSTEVPRAYVVRETDAHGRCSTLSAQSVYEFARSKLASYKSLDGGIFFVDLIPRTTGGNIQRFKLAQMDQYRRSISELLVSSTEIDNDCKRKKITGLDVRAEEKGTGARRSLRIMSTQPPHVSVTSSRETRKESRATAVRMRSRMSLVDKMKALEASRVLVELGRLTDSDV